MQKILKTSLFRSHFTIQIHYLFLSVYKMSVKWAFEKGFLQIRCNTTLFVLCQSWVKGAMCALHTDRQQKVPAVGEELEVQSDLQM